MRKQPIAPPQTITPKQLDNVVTQVREYRLITPLYGGGVTPNEADPVTVVRATEIRGHLRFWWRACRGGMFDGSAKKMWEKENEIWGKAHKKGDPVVMQAQTIQIIVEPCKQITSNDLLEPFKVEKNGYGKKQSKHDPKTGIPAYAAFPLEHTQEELQRPEIPHKKVYANVTFRLTISFPEDRCKDVEAAIWAWETFGGIGGRTRRGFGVLHLLKIDGIDNTDLPSSHSIEKWINSHLVNFIEGDAFPAGVPHLSTHAQFIVTAPLSQPIIVWKVLIDKLYSFRQYRDARHRSIWPEAKAIRSLLRNEAHSYLKKFPRAAFGLPIIFHFTGANAPTDNITLKEQGKDKKEESKNLSENSPEPAAIQGQNQGIRISTKERFASPLILRPFLCNDNRAVGLALLLEGSRVDLGHLVLEVQEKQRAQNKTLHYVQGTVTKSEAHNIEILKGETDVLQAFMQSFKGVVR